MSLFQGSHYQFIYGPIQPTQSMNNLIECEQGKPQHSWELRPVPFFNIPVMWAQFNVST